MWNSLEARTHLFKTIAQSNSYRRCRRCWRGLIDSTNDAVPLSTVIRLPLHTQTNLWAVLLGCTVRHGCIGVCAHESVCHLLLSTLQSMSKPKWQFHFELLLQSPPKRFCVLGSFRNVRYLVKMKMKCLKRFSFCK